VRRKDGGFKFISFYDLAFGLLFIMLFAFAIVSMKYEKEKKKENRLQIVMGEKELFNEGEFVFKDIDTATVVIRRSLDSLYSLWKSKYTTRRVKHILIIGHTDNKPISKKLKKRYHNPDYSNWNLSLDRANQVVQLIIRERLLDNKEGLNYSMLLPSGKSYYYPAIENVKRYLREGLNLTYIGDKSIDIASPDSIWNYIFENLSITEIEKLVRECNGTPLQREKNRRIEIRMEI